MISMAGFHLTVLLTHVHTRWKRTKNTGCYNCKTDLKVGDHVVVKIKGCGNGKRKHYCEQCGIKLHLI